MKVVDIKLSEKAQKELDKLRKKFKNEICSKCPLLKECDLINCRIRL